MEWIKRKKKSKFSNAGKKFEEKVAKKLGKKVEITNRNKVYYKNGKRYVETDIETKTCAIEIKSGRTGKRLQKQLIKYDEVTRKEPIAYAPNIPQKEKDNIKKLGYGMYSELRPMSKYIKRKEQGGKRWTN